MLTELPKWPVAHQLDDKPTVDEVQTAKYYMVNGKAHGTDGMPYLKCTSMVVNIFFEHVTDIIRRIWDEGGCSTGFQGCAYRAYLQTQGRPNLLWQSSRNIVAMHRGHHPSAIKRTCQQTGNSAGEQVRLQIRNGNYGNDLYCQANSRKIS